MTTQENQLEPRKIGRINVTGLATLTKREINRFMIVYVQALVAPLVTTLLFYTVFALAFGGLAREMSGIPFLKFLAPGLVMMTMVQNAFANTSSSMVIAKVQGNIVDTLMPPLSNLELMVGYITGGLARGLSVGVATTLALMVFADMRIDNIVIVITFAVLGTFMLSSLGMAAGIWSDKFDHMSAITNFVITPLAFLSGTFYSINSLPQMWQGIALYNPFFYMIDGFRAGFIGQSDSNLFIGVLVLLGINLALALLTLQMLRTGYKIKS
jgi:ABC-2 type transport system permease protein